MTTRATSEKRFKARLEKALKKLDKMLDRMEKVALAVDGYRNRLEFAQEEFLDLSNELLEWQEKLELHVLVCRYDDKGMPKGVPLVCTSVDRLRELLDDERSVDSFLGAEYYQANLDCREVNGPLMLLDDDGKEIPLDRRKPFSKGGM